MLIILEYEDLIFIPGFLLSLNHFVRRLASRGNDCLVSTQFTQQLNSKRMGKASNKPGPTEMPVPQFSAVGICERF